MSATSGNARSESTTGLLVYWPAARPCCDNPLQMKPLRGGTCAAATGSIHYDRGLTRAEWVTHHVLDWLDTHVYGEADDGL